VCWALIWVRHTQRIATHCISAAQLRQRQAECCAWAAASRKQLSLPDPHLPFPRFQVLPHTHTCSCTETEQETDPNANIDTDTDTSIFLPSAERVCELFDHYNTTVLQHTVTRCIAHTYELREFRNEPLVHCTATRSNESLVHCKTTDWNSTETQCNTLQMHTLLKRKNCVASRWSTATHLHCNMLQYAATHAPLKRWACVTEQTSWIAPHLPVLLATWRETVQKYKRVALCCNVVWRVAVRCRGRQRACAHQKEGEMLHVCNVYWMDDS